MNLATTMIGNAVPVVVVGPGQPLLVFFRVAPDSAAGHCSG